MAEAQGNGTLTEAPLRAISVFDGTSITVFDGRWRASHACGAG
jgi:hypothetical protein